MQKRTAAAPGTGPDVQAQRDVFRAWATVDPDRLVFIDESGANLAMGRSHALVPRGDVYVDPRPVNWGANLTMVGPSAPTAG